MEDKIDIEFLAQMGEKYPRGMYHFNNWLIEFIENNNSFSGNISDLPVPFQKAMLEEFCIDSNINMADILNKEVKDFFDSLLQIIEN